MTTTLPVASSRDVRRAGWSVLRRHRARAFVVLALFVAQACVLALPPLLIGGIVDRVRAGRHDVGWFLVALVVAAALSGLLEWQAHWRLAVLVEPEIARLREGFVASVARVQSGLLDAAGSGDVLSRASDDVQVLSEGASSVLARTLSTAITLVVVAAGLGALDPRFLLSLLAVAPLVIAAARWYRRVGPATYLAERDAQANRARHVLDTVRAAPTLRAFGLEERQVGVTREASWAHVRWEMRVRIVQNILLARVNVMELVGLLAVLAIGVWAGSSGASAGVITAGVLLYLRIMAPISELLFVADEWQSVLAALGRVLGVTTAAKDTSSDGESDGQPDQSGGWVTSRARVTESPERPEAVVQVDAVSHRYSSGPRVLHEVSLAIDAGQHVALVGPSGSGKSTLAAIISGEITPTEGTRRTHVGEREIATVTQENHVLAATLRDNLTVAAPDCDDGTLLRAMREIGADNLLAACTDGLDTRLGAGGVDLGPASAQLLALVRLHLVDPALVVLDEATAEAGVNDARRVERAARAVIDGRAALVVAHRLSQAQACDVVIVLDRGRIVEQGAPDDLLRRGGLYAKLWEVWERGPLNGVARDSTPASKPSPH